MLASVLTTMAQVTTSSINGKVVADGEEVIGATVTAKHVPSGTVYNAVTNVHGRYTIQGMRVGGPYEVTISYLGFRTEEIKNVQLALGEASTFNVNMQEDSKVLGEIVVTGKQTIGGSGASTNFSLQQIENAPTVNRNIYDIAKLSPLVNVSKYGGISIAGTNNRYNSFQIDGVVSNDVFGLSSDGTNGSMAGGNPISMDAIEQVQVVASPFDVRQSGFTGGAINAITKSGTNKFTSFQIHGAPAADLRRVCGWGECDPRRGSVGGRAGDNGLPAGAGRGTAHGRRECERSRMQSAEGRQCGAPVPGKREHAAVYDSAGAAERYGKAFYRQRKADESADVRI